MQQVLIHQKLPKKEGLADIKLEVDKSHINNKLAELDADKLRPISVDLKKTSGVFDKKFVKKDIYNAKIKYIQDQIPDITNLDTIAALKSKINEVKNEIRSITNLTTKSPLHDKTNGVKTKHLVLTT